MPTTARRTIALVALAVAIIAAAVALDLPQSVQAQSEEERYGKITARRTADDRIEFGWQPTDASGKAIGARVFPRARYLPQDAEIDRWLRSSPVEIEGRAIGRINARMRAVGRIEFGFTPTDGERILPPSRYFPHNATRGRWLSSTTITLGGAPPPEPVAEQPAGRFAAVSAGGSHTCALRPTGEIACWGWNRWGQSDAPAGRFTAVSAGAEHSCAIRESGEIECWGEDDDGSTIAPPGRFSAVSAGGSHTCALRAGSGEIACWGWTYVGPDGRFSAVSAGGSHTCALRAGSGEIACWGDNKWGQLDDIPAGRFSTVSAGGGHTCALRPTGEIACWGASKSYSYGKTIDEGQTEAPSGSFRAVSAGVVHTCALRTTGEIRCWGDNDYAQASAPPGRFSAVGTAGGHTCALRDTGAIVCWGWNDAGQSIPPAGRYTAVSADDKYACALREDGAITCWGKENDVSRTMDGDHTTPPGRFQAVINTSCGLREAGWIECWRSNWRSAKYIEGQTIAPRGQTSYGAVAVSAGSSYTCAIRADTREIECWFSSGTGAELTDAPAGRFSALGTGYCAIRESGEILCWGRDGSERFDDIPAGRFSAVSGTTDRGCAIRETGELACWGRRFIEAKNTGYPDYNRIPAPPPAGRFRAVIVADESACAIRESGEIACWGHADDSGRKELSPPPRPAALAPSALARAELGAPAQSAKTARSCAGTDLGTDQSSSPAERRPGPGPASGARPPMQTLAELQELAELAASYSAAYERARAVSPFDADALSVAAIDLASAAIDALYAIAAVAEQSQPQLSAALSKAAIVGAAALLERELAASGSIAPADASHALSDIRTLAQIVTDAVRSRVNRSRAAGCGWVNPRTAFG